MDYFKKLRLVGWIDAYYQPDLMNKREKDYPGFRDNYIKSSIEDLEKTGKTAISKFNSITGKQVYYTEDPNKVL